MGGEIRNMNERVVKVFLASSDELFSDRVLVGDMVRRLNNLYRKRGVEIELFKYEDFESYLESKPKQCVYNDKIRESDMFMALFHRKAGEYTIVEFDVAVDQYLRGDQPKVYTFMRNLEGNEQEEGSLIKFKERLYNELGHYWCRYGNSDTLLLNFVLQFQLLESKQLESSLEVKDSVVQLYGEPVVSLKDIPFAANNETYQKLVKQKAKLEERVQRYRERYKKDPDDMDFQQELSEANKELDEVCKELMQLETYLFDIAKTFAQKAGKACSERIRRAQELFEQGKASEANGILDAEDLNRDIVANLRRFELDIARIEEDRSTLLLNIDELLLKTKTAMADTSISIPERFNQASAAYEKAIELQEKLNLPPEKLFETLSDYASLHHSFNHFNEALPLYKKSLEIIRNLSAQDPDVYMPSLAEILNGLANLHRELNLYAESEIEFIEALKICRKLSALNPYTYLSDVAIALNNLALLHSDLNRYAESEKEYVEALDIYRKLSLLSPQAYLPYVAITLNNLANLHGELNRYAESEKEYVEALEIRRELSAFNPDAYLPGVAMTLNNLAILHYDLNRCAESEKEYVEALEIRRTLSALNPDTYLPDVATTLNNLANLHYKLHRYTDSEKEYLETLDIYKKLSALIPDAYLPYIAVTLNNLALLYYKYNLYVESEKILVDALEIRRNLSARNPDAYLPDVAMTLNNLAILHGDLDLYAASEKEYVEALGIYRKLSSINPDAYLSYVAGTLYNLANLHSCLNCYAESEKEYREALEIYRKFSSLNPDAYLPNVAMTLNNLGILLGDLNLYIESEKEYVEALDIYRKLYKTNPDEFLSIVVGILGNISFYRLLIKQFKNAEFSASEAINICKERKVPEDEFSWIYANLAFALLFQNKFDQAKNLIIEWNDKTYPHDPTITFKGIFIQYFDKFEQAGITHPDIAKIRELLK